MIRGRKSQEALQQWSHFCLQKNHINMISTKKKKKKAQKWTHFAIPTIAHSEIGKSSVNHRSVERVTGHLLCP